MDQIQHFFLCKNCDNKNFHLVYNFSLRLHGVNFSDKGIYDELTEELYQCTKCKMTYTKKNLEEGLSIIKKKNFSL